MGTRKITIQNLPFCFGWMAYGILCFQRHPKMRPLPAMASQEKNHVPSWSVKRYFAPLMRHQMFPYWPRQFIWLLYLLFKKVYFQNLEWYPVHSACVLTWFSCVQLCVMLWIVACQVLLSVGFSRQEYGSGLPCTPPGDLPNPGIEPTSLKSPALAGRFFTTSATWEACPMHGRSLIFGICLFIYSINIYKNLWAIYFSIC